MRVFRAAAAAALAIILSLGAACTASKPDSLQGGAADRPVYLPSDPGLTADPSPGPSATEPPRHQVFSGGVSIDGVDLKGMTPDDAKIKIQAKQKAALASVGVTIQYGDKSWSFTSKDVKCSFNTDAVLSNAWAISENKYQDESNGSSRFSDSASLATTLSVDPSPIEQKVRNLAISFYVPAKNSEFSGYNPGKPDGQRLVFTPAQPGKQVDADALWAAVQKEFTEGTYGSVQVTLQDVPAKITADDWMRNLKLVSRFSTIQNSSPARYTNIKTACAAITGHFIMPGEIFSFNDTTGPRTADKGYQMAHVINGGVVDNGLAGGTCQVSGTLFNAAARAGLTIAERHHHTLRSLYLPLGQDATVDYGHYDLQLQNDTEEPVLIIMYLGSGSHRNYVYAEVYGQPLPQGETIDLVSQVTKTVPAPNTVSYATSDSVKPGTTETVKPHEGWYVTTTRVYKQNGKVIRSEVLYTDYYKEAGAIIVYNPNDPKPAPSPSPSPSATASPSGAH